MKRLTTIAAKMIALAVLPCLAACGNTEWARYPKKKDNQYAAESLYYSDHYKTREIGYVAFKDSDDPALNVAVIDIRRVGNRYSLSTPISKSEETETGFTISSERGKDMRAAVEWRMEF